MGGVDKMDVLLSLYRISIRSRKWTFTIFDHFIYLAVCNSWLEHKNDCDTNKFKKKECMELSEVRNDLSDALLILAAQKSKASQRGRPTKSPHENSPTTSERSSSTASKIKCEVLPAVSIRYDGINHCHMASFLKTILG